MANRHSLSLLMVSVNSNKLRMENSGLFVESEARKDNLPLRNKSSIAYLLMLVVLIEGILFTSQTYSIYVLHCNFSEGYKAV